MRCIFCKSDSERSLSVEHIVPESLGNTEHILPPGWVCDTCNNYFSRKIEKPFLDSVYGLSIRFQMGVANKRGRIPSVKGLHKESRNFIELTRFSEDSAMAINSFSLKDETHLVSSLQAGSHGTVYFPMVSAPPADVITTRFVGKVALEVLAKSVLNVEGANNELVDQPELDDLRNYVRRGHSTLVWPIYMRHIYPPERIFPDSDFGNHQILHEWIILQTPNLEYFAIIALFGIEYAINLGGPELEGYRSWLEANNHRSPPLSTATLGSRGSPLGPVS